MNVSPVKKDCATNLVMWLPQDISKHVTVLDATTIKFEHLELLPPYTFDKATFTFKFASSQHYWPNDDPGNKYNGYIKEIHGYKDDEEMYGQTACILYIVS